MKIIPALQQTAGASRLQSLRPVRRVAELGSFGGGAGEYRMVSEFFDGDREDAHEAFQLGRQDNTTGFFINCKAAGDWMLHSVNCPHPGSTDWQAGQWGSLTKRRKACSTDRQELVEWARHHVVGSLKTCSDCKP